MNINQIWRLVGPGLVYAGAAVGVSHLVQSTRAGASFGYGLIWIVLLVNFLKYPFFEAAPRFVAATGKNLIEGYLSLGKWALWLFAFVTLSTVFAVQGAVTMVTSGLAIEISGVAWEPWQWSLILLVLCSILLLLGKYSVLDNVMKIIVVSLSVTSLVALIASFDIKNQISNNELPLFEWENTTHILFLVALIGWMPAPFDISVWQSMWIQEKVKIEKNYSFKRSLFDFHLGYWGTAILAVIFLILGANVFYFNGIETSHQAGLFASQLINIFTHSIGKWAYFFIAIAAFSTMLSTTIAVLDGFSRVLVPVSIEIIKKDIQPRLVYTAWLLTICFGGLLLITKFSQNMKSMVDFATSVSFLTTPILGWMNLKLMRQNFIQPRFRYPKFTLYIAYIGLFLISSFGLVYLYFLLA